MGSPRRCLGERPSWAGDFGAQNPGPAWHMSLSGLGSPVLGSPGPTVSGGPGLQGASPPPREPRGAHSAPPQQPQPGAEFYYPPFTILRGKQM